MQILKKKARLEGTLCLHFVRCLFTTTKLFFRNLCIEIGEKTNVYSLEVSMHGYEIENDDPAEDNEIITYSEEDCKFYSVVPDLLFLKLLELATLV